MARTTILDLAHLCSQANSRTGKFWATARASLVPQKRAPPPRIPPHVGDPGREVPFVHQHPGEAGDRIS